LERVAKWLAIDHQKVPRSHRQSYPTLAKILWRHTNITAEALESLISMEGETVHDIAKLATTPPSVLLNKD